MNLRVPKAGLLALIAAVAAAAVVFAVLMARFGGPTLRVSEPYTVSAAFEDTRGLTKRSEVLVRGVPVGEVESVELRDDDAVVKLAIDDEHAPLPAGATVRVGQKTLFGEAYVELDPGAGGRERRELDDGAAIPAANVLAASADVDEALSTLDAPARRDLGSVLREFGAGLEPPESAERVSFTLAELGRTARELEQLTTILDGQEEEIAAGVTQAGTVVETLAEHESALRAIIGSGRTTLAALASREQGLRGGVGRLPGTLARARSALAAARPLLAEARPLARDLALAAPDLERTLEVLPPVANDADDLLASLPGLETEAVPFLERTARVLRLAEPVAGPLAAALRNLEPIAGYLADRKRTFAAWFSNTGDLGSHRDAKGYFARFFVGFEPMTALGLPGGNYETNAYTGPDDALDNQPYDEYPRLTPYDPEAGR